MTDNLTATPFGAPADEATLPRRHSPWIAGVCQAVSDRTGVDALAIRILAVFGAVAGIPVYLGYAVLWSLLPKADGGSHLDELRQRRITPVWIAIAGAVLVQFTPLAAPITLFLIVGAALSGSTLWAVITVAWVLLGAFIALLSVAAVVLFLLFSPYRMRRAQSDTPSALAHAADPTPPPPAGPPETDAADLINPPPPVGASEWAVRQRALNDAERERAQVAEMAAATRRVTMTKYRSRSPRPFVTWIAIALGLAAGAIGTSMTWNSFTPAGALLVGGAMWIGVIGMGALVNAVTGRRTGWHMPLVHIASCFAVGIAILLCAFPDGIPRATGWGTHAKVLPASAGGSEYLVFGPVNDVTLTKPSWANGTPAPVTANDVASSTPQGVQAVQGNLTVRLARDIPAIISANASEVSTRLIGNVGSLPHELKPHEMLVLCPGSDPKIIQSMPEHWAHVCPVGLSSFRPSTPSSVVDDYTTTIAYEAIALSAPFGTITIDLDSQR